MGKQFEYEKYETAWCPGCGNFGILSALEKTLKELGYPPHEVLVIGGIGQAAKTPQYLNVNGFAGLHGRALPPATAAQITNHKLKVIVNTGDGDSYGEGGNHFMATIRRNPDIAHFVHNNQIYGLTKGQASPTSDEGHVTDFTPQGVINQSFNPLLTAIALGAGFVARAFSGDIKHLQTMMKKAISYNGYALVDILQPCISFNKVNTFKWYKERVYHLEDHKPEDKAKAMEVAQEWGDKIPIGIIYQTQKKTYTEHFEFLKKQTLLENQTDPKVMAGLLEEFMA